MGLARARARHVSGVFGGEIEPARAVAEQVKGLGRQSPGGLEVAGLAARLEQGERGAGHRRIVVEQGAGAGAPLAPGVQEPAVAAAQLGKHKIERGACAFQPRRLAEHGAGADQRGDGQAVPVGQHLVVAAGFRTLLAQGEQFRPRRGEARFVLRRAARSDAAQHRLAFPVSLWRLTS